VVFLPFVHLAQFLSAKVKPAIFLLPALPCGHYHQCFAEEVLHAKIPANKAAFMVDCIQSVWRSVDKQHQWQRFRDLSWQP